MPEVIELLAQRERARLNQALAESARAARAGGERYFLDDGHGNGGVVQAMIHPAFYHFWGQRLGYECWQDPQFVREFQRDNAFARVRNRPRKTCLRVEGVGAGLSGLGKFKKRY